MIDNLLLFKQFGFTPGDKVENHVKGNCIFCGSKDHFFVNIESENKTWDCKKCGKSGGFKSYLKEIVKLSHKDREPAIKALSIGRGIKPDVLLSAGIGYLPNTDNYIIPVYSLEKEIINLKIYNKTTKVFKNCAGCTSSMYNLQNVTKSNFNTVFLCEGEWDTLAMLDIFSNLSGTSDCIAIGAPGASIFKQNIIPFLAGKDVYIVYDNDTAGRTGTEKVIKNIFSIAGKVNVLNWPKELREGYDIRDLLNDKTAANSYKFILDNSTPVVNPDNQDQNIEVQGEKVDCQEVYDAFNKWLHLENNDIIDIIFGTVIVNRYAGDPLWLFIVAPPGFNKTEPLLSLSNCRGIETVSSLTPASLISGFNTGGADPSLIPRLNGKLLIVKDFTSVTGLPQYEREEIFSILRDAYDGECSKPFGSGHHRKYKSKFGILAAVTPAIEHYIEENAALGERFLQWRNKVPKELAKREVFIQRALGNVTHEVQLRADLNAVAKKVTLSKYADELPELSSKQQEQLIAMAQFIAMLRSSVKRDKYTRDIQYKSFSELGTRLVKQLYKLAAGISLFHHSDHITHNAIEILKHVARSSISSRYDDTIQIFYNKGYNHKLNVKELHDTTKISRSYCTMILDNLTMIGALIRENDTKGNAWFMLSDDMKTLLHKVNIYKKESEPEHKPKVNIEIKKKIVRIPLHIKKRMIDNA